MQFWEDKGSGIIIVGLKRGDRLFESLEQVAREADIHTGVVMSGIGSLQNAYIHTVTSNDHPPTEDHIKVDGPLEIVQFGGIIANYQPHIHISLWDRQRNYLGGHLHEGCTILTLSEISIHRCAGVRITRRPDQAGIYLLDQE